MKSNEPISPANGRRYRIRVVHRKRTTFAQARSGTTRRRVIPAPGFYVPGGRPAQGRSRRPPATRSLAGAAAPERHPAPTGRGSVALLQICGGLLRRCPTRTRTRGDKVTPLGGAGGYAGRRGRARRRCAAVAWHSRIAPERSGRRVRPGCAPSGGLTGRSAHAYDTPR
jgi:hypothetical protein